MSLSQALSSALAGLRVTQSAMSLVASNVANAETPGYVRKTLAQSATANGRESAGVRQVAVNRELDQYVQRQLRTEISGGAYATLRSDYYARLQDIFGMPGGTATLETAFNDFTISLQALTTSPESAAARLGVLNAAQVLTGQLNRMSDSVQSLRGDAELGLSDAVTRANHAIEQIAALNRQLTGMTLQDATATTLMDQRDAYIDELSHLMDIRVLAGENNQVSVFTNSGMQLVGVDAARLAFDAQDTIGAATQWDLDPNKRTLGSLKLNAVNGASVDLIANKGIRSGEIAALLELRDDILVQAQSQLDGLASAMASALSSVEDSGTAIVSGAQNGFDLDTGGMLAGNIIRLTYEDAGGVRHRISLVRVEDSSVLPLSASFTADPADEVIGVDFSGGLGAVVASLNDRFDGALVFSNPEGAVLRVLSDGGQIESASVIRTVTSFDNGHAALPFFTDGGRAYSGAMTSMGAQSLGFAGRIAVNPALLADPSRLVGYRTGIASGDTTRPDFIRERISQASLVYAPDSGIGSNEAPFSGSLSSYLRQVISFQGAMAENAANLAEGQDVVVSALQARLSENSAVNVDTEMAHLLNLQAAYGANARVMSTVKDMFDILMRIGA